MGIKGNFAGLRKMQLKLGAMADPAFRADLSKVLMHEALELVDEGFATSKAPDGSPWKRLALRNGQPLRDTRRLQSSFTGASSASGFKIGTNVAYARTHQDGMTIKAKSAKGLHFTVGGRHFNVQSVKIPQRQMVPEGKLSSRWHNALTSAAREYVAKRMKR